MKKTLFIGLVITILSVVNLHPAEAPMRVGGMVMTDQDGNQLSQRRFTYDARGRLVKDEWMIPGSEVVGTTCCYYDDANRAVLIVTLTDTTAVSHVQVNSRDGTGHIVEATWYDDHGGLRSKVTFAWNGQDEATGREYDAAMRLQSTFHLRRTRGDLYHVSDAQGFSTGSVGPSSVTHVFEHGVLARTELIFPAGKITPLKRRVMSYTRDDEGRLTRIEMRDMPGNTATALTLEWEPGPTAIDPEHLFLSWLHGPVP